MSIESVVETAKNALPMLGRVYRINDTQPALVHAVSAYIDGSVIVKVVWWDGNERKEAQVALCEIGAEVKTETAFGFVKKEKT